MKKKYITSLADVFTPAYDMTIDRPFTGNHLGYMVTFWRSGDLLTVNHFGTKGFNPVRPLIKTETHRINAVLSGLIAQCQEMNVEFECADDLPEGFSLADPSKLADLRK